MSNQTFHFFFFFFYFRSAFMVFIAFVVYLCGLGYQTDDRCPWLHYLDGQTGSSNLLEYWTGVLQPADRTSMIQSADLQTWSTGSKCNVCIDHNYFFILILFTLGCLFVSCRMVIGSGSGTAWPTRVGPKTLARLWTSILVSALRDTLEKEKEQEMKLQSWLSWPALQVTTSSILV